MALVLAPVSLPWPLFLTASLFTLFAFSMVARDTGKRIVAALLLALVLSAPAILHAEDVILANKCPNLTILDPEYWLLGCWMLP